MELTFLCEEDWQVFKKNLQILECKITSTCKYVALFVFFKLMK
jgi:hypothetical protein